MKTTKIYIEVPVPERLPEETGFYFSCWDGGLRRVRYFDQKARSFIDPSSLYPTPDYWLEPVEVPNHEEIEAGKGFMKNEMFALGYNRAVNWILDKLKINQK